MSSSRRALLVIDVQNDFITGSLALPVSSQGQSPVHVVATINRLTSVSPNPFDLVVFSQDWHPPNHCSFVNSTTQPASATDKWAQHCVQNTWGAELHEQLNVTVPDEHTQVVFVKKGTDPNTDGYSAFGPDTNLEQTLRRARIEHVYVVGLALDYCVKCTALDAVRAGFTTTIILDACHAVDEHCLSSHLAEVFRAANIEMITTEQLLPTNIPHNLNES